MGKASSSKKVARAARAGGRSSAGRQRNLLFPSVIGAILLFGSALVAFAANDRKNDTDVPPVANKDHWHAAYGIYVCGKWQPNIPTFESSEGIHTHGDGVIHIHPFTQAAAGDNATLGRFLDQTDVKLTNNSLTVGKNELAKGAKTWNEGKDRCDGKDGEVIVAQWRHVTDKNSKPALLTSDFGDIRFRGDGEGYTIAFVAKGTKDIPKPKTAANLAELGATDAGATATSTTAAGGSTTTTGASKDTTTSAPGG
jgi:hypothetical protein